MELNKQIAKDIGIDPEYVCLISKRNNKYAKFYVKKKDGKMREVLQPSKELKLIQKWLVRNIFNNFPVSEFSTAYSKGNSIKKNAYIHRNASYILHMDIQKFFPTIDRMMLEAYFNNNTNIKRRLNLTDEDVDFILDICLYKGKNLVIGSVASPIIANMIMYQFDIELTDKLKELGAFEYSRYADDIVISSNKYIEYEIVEVIQRLIKEKGFTVNKNKTHFMSKNKRRQVTGVVIDNNQNTLSVGNKKYKELQREIYQYLIRGKGDSAYIKGYLSYVKGLNATQYEQLKNIYLKYDVKKQIFD